MAVILELPTSLFEYLDLLDVFVQCAAEQGSLLHQNASIIPCTYYAWNYAGIIASSLF